jgi:hypothetical protein
MDITDDIAEQLGGKLGFSEEEKAQLAEDLRWQALSAAGQAALPAWATGPQTAAQRAEKNMFHNLLAQRMGYAMGQNSSDPVATALAARNPASAAMSTGIHGLRKVMSRSEAPDYMQIAQNYWDEAGGREGAHDTTIIHNALKNLIESNRGRGAIPQWEQILGKITPDRVVSLLGDRLER